MYSTIIIIIILVIGAVIFFANRKKKVAATTTTTSTSTSSTTAVTTPAHAGDAYLDQLIPQDELYKFEKKGLRWTIYFGFIFFFCILSAVFWHTKILDNQSVSWGQAIATICFTIGLIYHIDFPGKRSSLNVGEIGFISFLKIPLQSVSSPGIKPMIFMKLKVGSMTILEDPEDGASPEVITLLQSKGIDYSGGAVFVIEANHVGDPNSQDEFGKPQTGIWIVVVRMKLIGRFYIRFLRAVGSVKNLRSLVQDFVLQTIQSLGGKHSLSWCRGHIEDYREGNGRKLKAGCSRLVQEDIESGVREPIYDPATGLFSVLRGSFFASIESVSLAIFASKELTTAQSARAVAVVTAQTTVITSEASKTAAINAGIGAASSAEALAKAAKIAEAFGYDVLFKAMGIKKNEANKRMTVFATEQARKSLESNGKFVITDSNVLGFLQKMADAAEKMIAK